MGRLKLRLSAGDVGNHQRCCVNLPTDPGQHQVDQPPPLKNSMDAEREVTERMYRSRTLSLRVDLEIDLPMFPEGSLGTNARFFRHGLALRLDRDWYRLHHQRLTTVWRDDLQAILIGCAWQQLPVDVAARV